MWFFTISLRLPRTLNDLRLDNRRGFVFQSCVEWEWEWEPEPRLLLGIDVLDVFLILTGLLFSFLRKVIFAQEMVEKNSQDE